MKEGRMFETTNVLDLTDLSMMYHFDEEYYPAFLKGTVCNRIYLGSYFCDKYMLKTINIMIRIAADYFRKEGIRITLVVPVFSEHILQGGKNAIEQALYSYADLIDEIVVNDYGMLRYLKHLRGEYGYSFGLIAGRLFFRNYRDARFAQGENISGPIFFPAELKGLVEAADLDLVHEWMDFSEIPEEIRIHIHYPYVYATCSAICEFASARQPDHGKFRTMLPCGNACMRSYIMTRSKQAEYLHLGKAVYTKACDEAWYSRQPDRFIYWPAAELLQEGGSQ